MNEGDDAGFRDGEKLEHCLFVLQCSLCKFSYVSLFLHVPFLRLQLSMEALESSVKKRCKK